MKVCHLGLLPSLYRRIGIWSILFFVAIRSVKAAFCQSNKFNPGWHPPKDSVGKNGQMGPARVVMIDDDFQSISRHGLSEQAPLKEDIYPLV
jgi:hypothetical protein